MLKHTLIIAATLSLSACASLSKEECLNADWYQIGYQDGTRGNTSGRFNSHVEACAEYAVRPERRPYSQGREQGLLQYCQADNGLQEGLNGRGYANVCPSHLADAFLDKYRQGKRIYELEQEINALERDISSMEYKLKKKADKLSDHDKKEYPIKIRELKVRIDEKNKQLYYLKGQAGVY